MGSAGVLYYFYEGSVEVLQGFFNGSIKPRTLWNPYEILVASL